MSSLTLQGAAGRPRPLNVEDRQRLGRALLILRAVGVQVTARLDRTVGAVVTRNGEVAILMTLRTAGPQRPAQLAVASGLTTGGLSKAIDRLERHGLISRSTRGVDGDGRAVMITLTEKGERTANTLEDVASAALREHRAELDELVSIAAHFGVPVDSAGPGERRSALARLARVGVTLTEALRRSPIDDHMAILVLCVLDREGQCRPGHLIEVLGLSSGGVTKLVDRLVARGFVERASGTLPDRRGVTMSITGAGREELTSVLGIVVGYMREMGSAAGGLGPVADGPV